MEGDWSEFAMGSGEHAALCGPAHACEPSPSWAVGSGARLALPLLNAPSPSLPLSTSLLLLSCSLTLAGFTSTSTFNYV